MNDNRKYISGAKLNDNEEYLCASDSLSTNGGQLNTPSQGFTFEKVLFNTIKYHREEIFLIRYASFFRFIFNYVDASNTYLDPIFLLNTGFFIAFQLYCVR